MGIQILAKNNNEQSSANRHANLKQVIGITASENQNIDFKFKKIMNREKVQLTDLYSSTYLRMFPTKITVYINKYIHAFILWYMKNNSVLE